MDSALDIRRRPIASLVTRIELWRLAMLGATFGLVAAVLSGCFHFPLAMNEAQWLALTPEQQREARTQQTLLDKRFDRIRALEEERFDDAYAID